MGRRASLAPVARAAELVDSMAEQVHPTVKGWIQDSHNDSVATTPCTQAIGWVK